MKIVAGRESPTKAHRIGIVVSRFHEDITTPLLDSALKVLHGLNFTDENIVIVNVAGSWEIPFATRSLIQYEKVDGVVTLGCLIKGETAHFDVIANSVTMAIQRASDDFDVPITLGILTCYSKPQALARVDGSVCNMGEEATRALVDLLLIKENLKKNSLSKINIPDLEQ